MRAMVLGSWLEEGMLLPLGRRYAVLGPASRGPLVLAHCMQRWCRGCAGGCRCCCWLCCW